MPYTCQIHYREEPAPDGIGGGITGYNSTLAGRDKNQDLCFVVEDAAGEVLGGIIGNTDYE